MDEHRMLLIGTVILTALLLIFGLFLQKYGLLLLGVLGLVIMPKVQMRSE